MHSSERPPDACRLCLSTLAGQSDATLAVRCSSPLIEGDAYGRRVVDVLNKHFWFALNAERDVDAFVCRPCWDIVLLFHEFYMSVMASHAVVQAAQLDNNNGSDDDELTTKGIDFEVQSIPRIDDAGHIDHDDEALKDEWVTTPSENVAVLTRMAKSIDFELHPIIPTNDAEQPDDEVALREDKTPSLDAVQVAQLDNDDGSADDGLAVSRDLDLQKIPSADTDEVHCVQIETPASFDDEPYCVKRQKRQVGRPKRYEHPAETSQIENFLDNVYEEANETNTNTYGNDDDITPIIQPVKRRRGRPPNIRRQAVDSTVVQPVKRARGRPRKVFTGPPVTGSPVPWSPDLECYLPTTINATESNSDDKPADFKPDEAPDQRQLDNAALLRRFFVLTCDLCDSTTTPTFSTYAQLALHTKLTHQRPMKMTSQLMHVLDNVHPYEDAKETNTKLNENEDKSMSQIFQQVEHRRAESPLSINSPTVVHQLDSTADGLPVIRARGRPRKIETGSPVLKSPAFRRHMPATINQMEANDDDYTPTNSKPKAPTQRQQDNALLRRFFALTCDLCVSATTPTTTTTTKKKFSTYGELAMHTKLIHLRPKLALRCCDRKFFKRADALEHCRWHLDPKIFACPHCDHHLATSSALYSHMHRLHPSGDQPSALDCPHCAMRFAYTGALHDHVRRLHDATRPFECFDCHRRCDDAAQLRTHMQRHSGGARVFVCDRCGRLFASPAALERHQHLHHGLGTLQCPDCGLRVRRPGALLTHRRQQHGHRINDSGGGGDGDQQRQPSAFACERCDFVAASPQQLAAHRRQQQHQPHRCRHCERSFGKKLARRKHEATHTDVAVHQCAYCQTSFRSDAELCAHRRQRHVQEVEKADEEQAVEVGDVVTAA